MKKSINSRPVAIVSLVLLAMVWLQMLGGCGPRSPSLTSSDPSKGPSVAQSDAADADSKNESAEVADLEKSGGKLKLNASGNVTDADLRGIVVDDPLASKISKMPAIQSLLMDKSNLTDSGWAQLGQLLSLRQFELRQCTLSNQQLQSFLGKLQQLRILKLSGKDAALEVDDTAMDSVANCKQLKVLALDGLMISEQGLAKLTGLADLTELYLANTLADDSAAEVIAKFGKLRKLRLAHTRLTGAGLAKLTALGALEDLDLSECSLLSDDALDSLGKMGNLRRLNLWRVPISDAGVERLAGLNKMEWLNLDNTQLSDAGLDHLAGMNQLVFLHIGSTAVTDAGMPKLKPLRSLKDLNVTRTTVTDAGATALRGLLPNTAIQLKYNETE